MDFTLRILGTASAMPVSDRFPSAQVLSVHGRLFLVDCGEGTQFQLVKYGVSMMKIDTVCLSHIHGDHVFGLFGLLSTLGMKGRTAPLQLYAPRSFAPILKFYLSYYGEGLPFEIRFHPVEATAPELLYETKGLELLAFPLRHKIETFGYLFREKRPQWNVRKDKLAEYGFTLTEIGALKRGEPVVRGEQVISNAEAAYLPYAPRSYAYCSDTAPFPELSGWVKGVDLLYHETTFLEENAELAENRHHATTFQAARCALEAGAGRLLIGHYSSRHGDIPAFQEECRRIFPQTYATREGEVYEVPMKSGDGSAGEKRG